MNTPKTIHIANLHPFEGHPYQVRDDDEMDTLVESIREHGILTPLIVRPLEDVPNEYEVISGHRRLHAAQKAGIFEVPAFVHAVSREEAAIQLVDSNLHREHILPSEKAFAYKMKFDALKHQGKTSGQVGPKLTVDAVSDEDSGRQVKRYIRLTNLIPPLLTLMDEGRIAFTVGVELSYLTIEEQRAVLEAIELYDCTPSYSQACRLHRDSEMMYAADTRKRILSVMSEEKPNQREQIRLRRDRLQQYFPAGYTDKQIENDIIAGLDLLKKQRYRDRGAR
jgi:ParB family chromosome partitioning protein